VKKLTAAERELDKLMLELLEFAHATRWRNIGNDPDEKAAAQLLKKRGLIEINEVSNQFRLKKQTSR
jgi:hypothetical protein